VVFVLLKVSIYSVVVAFLTFKVFVVNNRLQQQLRLLIKFAIQILASTVVFALLKVPIYSVVVALLTFKVFAVNN
jgi:hypothetical protein